jgi:hypothetical protein
MTKIKAFGQNELAIVSAKVLKALETLGDEIGVKFTTNGGQYGTVGGFIRLKVDIEDVGNGLSGAQAEYNRMSNFLGMKPDWFGVPFLSQGTEYKICGVNPGSPKYRMMVERVYDGKQFKMTVQGVKMGLQTAFAKRGLPFDMI